MMMVLEIRLPATGISPTMKAMTNTVSLNGNSDAEKRQD